MANAACRKFAVHGLAVELLSHLPQYDAALQRLLGSFAVEDFPDGFFPITGRVKLYDESELIRHLSNTASPVSNPGELFEVYADAERFWIVDERWGLTEINLLKSEWRTWLLPAPALDPFRVVEMAVLWPMAQLLRLRGLHLLPAASICRDGWAALILSPINLEPELSALAKAGYKVLGQRWTAVREEDDRIALLHMPGQVERDAGPRLRVGGDEVSPGTYWTDLHQEHPAAKANHAFCDAVLVVASGRRPSAALREVPKINAIPELRRNWPILELHPNKRHSQLPGKLVGACASYELQLSRDPADLLSLLDSPYGLHLTPWLDSPEEEENSGSFLTGPRAARAPRIAKAG